MQPLSQILASTLGLSATLLDWFLRYFCGLRRSSRAVLCAADTRYARKLAGTLPGPDCHSLLRWARMYVLFCGVRLPLSVSGSSFSTTANAASCSQCSSVSCTAGQYTAACTITSDSALPAATATSRCVNPVNNECSSNQWSNGGVCTACSAPQCKPNQFLVACSVAADASCANCDPSCAKCSGHACHQVASHSPLS